MAHAKLRQQRIDRTGLYALATTMIPQLGRMNVIVSVRHQEWQCREMVDDLTVRFGFTLLGRDFDRLQIRRATLTSVQWSSGQATSLAGHDMNDWSVAVCYDRKGAKGTIVSDYHEDVEVVGPDGPKHEAAALGASLADFFRSAGIELHPMKNKCGFTTRKQNDASVES